jgi:outer membrane protein assembly factor BamD (BamD/ComL family)
MADGPRYDRNDLLRARELLERSLTTHPRGVAVREAREDFEQVLEMLAEAELIVADFYARRGVPVGEQLRLANAALAYPETQAGRQAAERLAALGIDVASLRGDPALQSLDKVRATVPLWEQQRAESRMGLR